MNGRSSAVRLRVTRSWSDGRTETWETPYGDQERSLKRRMRAAGTVFRTGPGWAERDGVVAIQGWRATYTDRMEWPDHLAIQADTSRPLDSRHCSSPTGGTMPDHRPKAPKRIQRCRTPGWRMPPGAVYVGRPTMWGNPWRVGQARTGPTGEQLEPMTAERAVYKYREWLTGRSTQPYGSGVDRGHILNNLHQLRGKDLACWCPVGAACHADVLLELANQPKEA